MRYHLGFALAIIVSHPAYGQGLPKELSARACIALEKDGADELAVPLVREAIEEFCPAYMAGYREAEAILDISDGPVTPSFLDNDPPRVLPGTEALQDLYEIASQGEARLVTIPEFQEEIGGMMVTRPSRSIAVVPDIDQSQLDQVNAAAARIRSTG